MICFCRIALLRYGIHDAPWYQNQSSINGGKVIQSAVFHRDRNQTYSQLKSSLFRLLATLQQNYSTMIYCQDATIPHSSTYALVTGINNTISGLDGVHYHTTLLQVPVIPAKYRALYGDMISSNSIYQ